VEDGFLDIKHAVCANEPVNGYYIPAYLFEDSRKEQAPVMCCQSEHKLTLLRFSVFKMGCYGNII